MRYSTRPACPARTVFLTDIASYAEVNEVYADVFGDWKPARSVVQVGALPKGTHVQVEMTAIR